MTTCKHCGQTVEDYDAHFPMCPTVRMALDDTYWPGQVGHYTVSAAEKTFRRNERVRKWRATKSKTVSECVTRSV